MLMLHADVSLDYFIRIGIDSTPFVTTTSDIFIARAIIFLSIHRNRGSGVP